MTKRAFQSLIERNRQPNDIWDRIEALERKLHNVRNSLPGLPGVEPGQLAYWNTTGELATNPEGSNQGTNVPVGGIILWSGAVASIPGGWALCNGSNGTPDLRDRFVVGAGSTYAVAATGGATTVDASHTHGDGSLGADSGGAHTHGAGTLATDTEAAHSHGYGTLATDTEAAHTHGPGTLNTASDTHDHTLTIYGHTLLYASGTESLNVMTNVTMNTDAHDHDVDSGTTASGGSHDHDVTSGSTGTGGGHSHDVTGSSASDGAHTHTVSGTTATGGSATLANLPPYYALAYIMRTG